MGITIGNCCGRPGYCRLNVFQSAEDKTIEIPVNAPSSIDTANIVIGSHKKKLTLSSFEILKSIGNGAFAKVFLVRLKGGNRLYALKLIPKKTIRNDYALNAILKEREILLKSNHPFILKLRYSFQDPAYFCYVMDYMKGGPISKYIEGEGKNGLAESVVQWYAAQVLLALQCLHETMNVVYRDLKPDNVLVDEHGNIKLADFGISQVGAEQCNTYCGTPLYLAPEILNNQPYQKTVDFWNFGCFVSEMLTGENPFASAANLNELFAKIKATDFNLPPALSPQAVDLVRRLLVGNPSERLGAESIEQIKSHPFFAGVDWTEMLKNRRPGPLNARYNKEEVMLKALNVRLPGMGAEKSMQLKGFTYNENFNVDSPSFNP